MTKKSNANNHEKFISPNKRFVDTIESSSVKKLDDNGVLIYKIPYTNTWDYYPIHIGNFALSNINKYNKVKDERYKKIFFNQLNWLYNNLKIEKNFAVFHHHFKVPFYNFTNVPWVHGLAQGHCLNVLLNAYELTQEKKYLKRAEEVYNSFEVEIQKGGVKFTDKRGNIWLEEYALLPPPHVLNGFITILFSIKNFYEVTKNAKPKKMWEEGLKTIKNNLPKYDTGYWSIYNLIHNIPSTEKYHKFHVKQLKRLYIITEDSFFNIYAKRWEDYSYKKINIYRSKIYRGLNHLKRYGIGSSINRYYLNKKWMKREE
jgi:hypothetical protein